MISCFKGTGATSGLWVNNASLSQNAVYTSVSDFNQDRVPKISKIIESLRQFDVFKYSAYRTAFKLRTIQKASKLHIVDLSVINSILKDYECTGSSINETITLDKAENLICTLYTEAGKKIGISEEPNVMALLFLAFLQNTFAEDDKPLLFIHVKIALVLFCSAKLSEKFKHFFYFCANGNSINKENLHQLLTCLSKVAEVVGEQVTFGTHLVPAAVKHLLKFSKGHVTLKKFQKWLLLEPQTLVWISTLHRVSVSEITQHSVSCDICHANTIFGLRYRCLQCINYNLCQNCFLCGHLNKRHKENHQVQEFCHPASAWEETKATLNTLKNKLSFTRPATKPYLSFDEESLYESVRDITKNTSRNSLLHHTLKKTTAAYIVKELTSIVRKLEDDKKQISVVVENFNKENEPNNLQQKCESENTGKEFSNGECLQTFNFSLEKQLERLKELLQSLQSPTNARKDPSQFVSPVPHIIPFSKADHFFESTPLNSAPEPNKVQPHFPSSNFDDTEQQRNQSTSLDFTSVLSSPNTSDLTGAKTSKSMSPSLAMSMPSENYSTSMSLGLSKYLNVMSSLNLSERMAKLAENNFSPIYMYSSSDISKSLNQRSPESKSSSSGVGKSLNPSSTESKNSCSDISQSLNQKSAEFKYSSSDISQSLNQRSAEFKYSSSDISQSLNQRSAECKYSVTPMRSARSYPSLNRASSTFTLNKNESVEALDRELEIMLQHIADLLPQVSGLSNDSPAKKEAVANSISKMENAVRKISHISLALSTGSTDL